jgi:lysyl-tRNA synthetase class 2
MSDPVPEETISKNELKRRLKAEKAKAEKAEKEAARTAKQATEAKSAGADKAPVEQESCDPGEYFTHRKNFVNQSKSNGGNPYPHKFQVTVSLTEYIEKYASLQPGT